VDSLFLVPLVAVKKLVEKYQVELIAIGNGTAGTSILLPIQDKK
jgi:hypothetical protein